MMITMTIEHKLNSQLFCFKVCIKLSQHSSSQILSLDYKINQTRYVITCGDVAIVEANYVLIRFWPQAGKLSTEIVEN